MVNDAWSNMPSFSSLIGGPGSIGLTPEKIPEYVRALHAMDYPRQEGIRQQTASIVKDQSVAEKLKAYYPSWCKRPGFHDDYLPCFNRPIVHLVDTDGKGVDHLTSVSLVANGHEYPLDCLIFSTGFRSPSVGSPAARAGITITGRNGLTLDNKWDKGVATLHGVCSHDFPNLFWPGPAQAAASANQMFVLDVLSERVAYIISKAQKKAGEVKKVIIEPTVQGEEDWSMRVLVEAMTFATMVGCTPGYLNKEGETDEMIAMGQEARMKAARAGIWGPGINDFTKLIGEWRAEGKLQGLKVSVF